MRVVRVGSRDSKLAVVQAEMVMEAIRAFDPEIVLELVLMKTTGDKILDRTLDKIGGKGLFVKELDEALENNLVDITVHSCKDLPAELPKHLPIVAFSKREDVRDVLILPQHITDDTKPLGCCSKRRMWQLRDLDGRDVQPVRGNLQTRLRKLDAGEYSGIILAAAGIKRLGLQDRISRYYTTEEMIPAAGQGVVAVQGRQGENTDYLQLFHCAESAVIVAAERAYVKALDGGCSSPIAAYGQLIAGELFLQGLYVDELREVVRTGFIKGAPEQAEQIGYALAEQLRNGE